MLQRHTSPLRSAGIQQKQIHPNLCEYIADQHYILYPIPSQ